jgi:quinol-cytochrome oxidoreductase complex cytochrome b subunit
MSILDYYIFFIFFIKIIFIILAIVNLYLKKQLPVEEKNKNKSDKIKKQLETQQKIEYWKTRIELLFKFLMALLLIYIFNPRQNRIHLINQEAKVLFFLFGFILIFTANWKQIFKESQTVINIQSVLNP